ncbi:MAG: hypothetical protein U0L05_02955 [Schaedlerella sp.]|nr:hypothetical protein [Schaedlerella sp.]
MKKYFKFINALLYLSSFACIFMSMVKVAAWKLSGASLVKMGFVGTDRGNGLQYVMAYAEDFTMSIILLVLAIGFLSIVGMILSLLLKPSVVYVFTILLSVINTICVTIIYTGFNKNINDINRAMDFFGVSGVAEVYHFTFIFWILLHVAVVILSVAGVVAGNKKEVPVKGQIYTEQFNNRKNSLQQNHKDLMRGAVPVQSPVKPTGAVSVQQPMKSKTVHPVQNQEKHVEFGGAIVGKTGMYSGKAYPLKERYKVFFADDSTGVNISKYEESYALAGVYYINKYQEYCVDVKQSRAVYLASGQPLGVGREYYLPRGTEIYIKDKRYLFVLA